ncbi:MAG: outer membrane beta-barrel protein [Bacteroidaceae bacterium]|nr:outer membrane beta-barrel protein [Bacteroidaceae bacterium]
MKKLIFTLLITAVSVLNASAQFEKGKFYLNGSLPNFGISYSDTKDLGIGLELNAGYFFADNLLLVGSTGFEYNDSKWKELYAGIKGRYYILQNGLFLGAGARYLHEYKNFNDLQVTPEIGYCFFLGRNVAVEPSVYYNMSISDFAHKSEVGLKVGISIFLDTKRNITVLP